MRNDIERIPVTTDNLEDLVDAISSGDQRELLIPGNTISVFYFTYHGGQSGEMTVNHDTGRGGICFGGDSNWGDWDDDTRVLTLDFTDDGIEQRDTCGHRPGCDCITAQVEC